MFGTAGVSSMKISTSMQTAFENVSGASALNIGDTVSIRGPMFVVSGVPAMVASKVQKR
jgi:hypothetical protein